MNQRRIDNIKIQDILRAVREPLKSSEHQWMAFCPSHNDGATKGKRSLSISIAEDGKVLINCFAGCSYWDIVDKLGLKRQHEKDYYNYCNSHGGLVYQTVRYYPKTFRQRRPDPIGEWIWNLKGVEPLPYRLPELIKAIEEGQTIFIVEGEKDVDNLKKIGLTATCNHGGVGKWKSSHSEWFPGGAEVVILPDNDEPGSNHADNVAESLVVRGCNVKVVPLPGLPEKGDISDWLDEHLKTHTESQVKNELLQLCAEVPYSANSADSAEGGEQNNNEWPSLAPLEKIIVPPFPTDSLPDWVKNYVLSLSEAKQTPPDLAAMLTLSMIALTLAKKVKVEVRPDWTEPLNIWTVSALPSGNRKSPVFSDMVEPLIRWQKKVSAKLEPHIIEANKERKLLEVQLRRIQNDASNVEEALAKSREIALQIARITIPVRPIVFVDDISPEKLANLMGEQYGKLAILSAEGNVFQQFSGAYSSNPNLNIYLKGYSGEDVRVDRIQRDTDYIEGATLTLGITVQPEVMRHYANNIVSQKSGLLARFLYSMPDSPVGYRLSNPPYLDEVAQARYYDNIDTLLNLQVDTPKRIMLTPEARAKIHEFQDWIEPKLSPYGEYASINEWGCKLAGTVVRIAGILHFAENVNEPNLLELDIQEDTVESAISIAHYLIPHTKAVFQLIGEDPDILDADYVIKWIVYRKWRIFSRRDLFNGLKGNKRYKRVADLDPILSILLDRGYIRRVPPEKKTGPGRYASPVYEVNPYLYKADSVL